MFADRIIVAIKAFTLGVFVVLVFTETALGEITRDGLVAEYHFEGSAYDSSGNKNTGSVNNAIYVDGKFGKALYFNGINSSVRVPDSMSLRPVSEISFEAWIRVKEKTTTWSSILSKMEQQQDSGYELYLLPGNVPRFGMISSVGGKTRLEGSNIPGDTWTHIAATYDGNALILYINGEFDSFLEKPRFVFPSKDDLWIGCWKNIDHFSGVIDEVRIYNRSLSSMEIKANYEASPHPQVSTQTPTPTPVPISGPAVVATPTGKSIYTRVASSKFAVLNFQINAGDEVMWDNLDEKIYTIVEMDKKIDNITLAELGKAKYTFNTSGNYRFCLYEKYRQIATTQYIDVIPTNTLISTPNASPIVISPTLTIAQIATATPTSISTPSPKSQGFEVILAGTGIIIALILRRK